MDKLCPKCRLRSTNPKQYCDPCIKVLDQEIKDHWLPIVDSSIRQLEALKRERKITDHSHEKMRVNLTHRQKVLETKRLVGGDEYRRLLIELSERQSIYKDIRAELEGRRIDAETLLKEDRRRFADELVRLGKQLPVRVF